MWVLLVAGLVATAALVIYLGFDEIASAVAGAGWGLLAVSLFHLAPLALATLGWRAFLEGPRPFFALLHLRWISESVNNLLPVAQVGGDLVRVVLLQARGWPRAAAAASVVADVTAGLAMELVFTLAGVAMLAASAGAADAWRIGIALLALALILAGFCALQRRGLFRILARALKRIGLGKAWAEFTGDPGQLDVSLARIYASRGAFLAGSTWRLAAWIAGSGEVWIAARALGSDLSLPQAILVESLGQAIRTVAFAIPGALGVQEGSFVLLGRLVGLSPEIAVSLSLVKRVREILLGAPGLLAWAAETRRQRGS
jgi:putative membrane protein